LIENWVAIASTQRKLTSVSGNLFRLVTILANCR